MFKIKLRMKPSYYLNKFRIYVMFVLIFGCAALFIPNFFNQYNLNSLLKTTNVYATLTTGMTIVMICGQIDLSIQATMNLCAVVTLTMFSKIGLGWPLAILIGLALGLLMGLVNGTLVAVVNINSWITTLGTMFIAQGISYMCCEDGSIGVGKDFALSDWITKELFPMFTPATLLTILLVIVFGIVMAKTRFGRQFYLLGANAECARAAGISKVKKLMTAFLICGLTSAIAGIVMAIGQATAVPNMGEKGVSPQLVTIAACIIGGVDLLGGKGTVVRSYFAALTMITIFNMLSCLGWGYEIQLFAAGLLLSVILLFEAISEYQREKVKGIRKDLLAESQGLRQKYKKA